MTIGIARVQLYEVPDIVGYQNPFILDSRLQLFRVGKTTPASVDSADGVVSPVTENLGE